jgi:N,N-dimethylformamidase
LRPAIGVDDAAAVAAVLTVPASLANEAALLIGAVGGDRVHSHFNGKIEDPILLGAAVDGNLAASLDLLALDPRVAGDLIGGWDFSRGISGIGIEDIGPHGLHGALVNLPTRAVMGARWSGREQCWRHAPRDYAAIHFHEDDLYDCGWQTDFRFEIPEGFRSGVYGIRLQCGAVEDIVPVYVRPKLGQPQARIAFLASTFTYQVYANHARGNYDDAYRQRAEAWGAYPWNPDAHPDYGRSTYNRFADRSGISLSSRLRPILTMRPGFLTFVDARGSGLRHFPADTHLLDWLQAKGHEFDVITDEDLDDFGVDILKPYAVVLTGSHPEYHTLGMLDALQNYVDDGGRLVYLGGNGFYWRVARNPDLPGVLEIRRAEGGIRAWAAEPGEYYNMLDGQYGGLWRRNNRYPQQLAGVGFSAQGLFDSSYYRRLPASRDPRAAWIFDGVDDDILGDFGLSGGGAAGFELDRADVRLGTPGHALVLAASEAHGPSFIVVPEELLSHIATLSGEPPERLIRGELVYFETPKGGAVFSVGSITFCGSLSHRGYDNNISQIMDNVVRRFSAG